MRRVSKDGGFPAQAFVMAHQRARCQRSQESARIGLTGGRGTQDIQSPGQNRQRDAHGGCHSDWNLSCNKVKSFLKRWNVTRRLSSECDPSALTTAKLRIESTERTLRGYTIESEFLHCDGFSRAISRYENTSCRDIGVNPSNAIRRDLEEQLPAATDVSEVRKQAVATNVPKVRK